MRDRLTQMVRFHYDVPDISSGITEGEQPPHDVNTQEGFDRSLAAKLGKELPDGYSAGPSTSIADGLTFGDDPSQPPTGQPRDPSTGRFAPREGAGDQPTGGQEGEPATPPAQQQQEPPAPTVDDRIANLERQLTEAQTFIGRQAHEIGVLRQTAQTAQSPQAPAPLPLVSTELAEQVFDWVERDGFRQAMTWAIQNNRHDLHDVILQAGHEMQLPEAREYEINLRVQEALLAQGQAPRDGAKEGDEFLQQLKSREAMKGVVATIKSDTPDFVQLKEHVEKALQENQMLAELVSSGDAQRIEQGLRLATQVARGYAAQDLAAAAAREATKATPEREAAKRAAQVATGSARVGTSGQAQTGSPTEEERQKAIADFKKAIFETPTTSIADGLTFG